MGCLPRSACLRSLCLTRHLNLLDIRECLEIWDYQLWYVPSKVVLNTMTIHFEVWPGVWENSDRVPVKEEDSITDVENAVLDLGVVNPLCLFFIDQRVLISFITELIKFIQLNFPMVTSGFIRLFRKPAYMEYTQWVFCKRCGKPIKHHRAYRQENGILPEIMLPSIEEISFLLVDNPFDHEFPALVVCDVSKPWVLASRKAIELKEFSAPFEQLHQRRTLKEAEPIGANLLR
ncbi:hypothetical protein Tco_1428686 [Tanacetum coccineum]